MAWSNVSSISLLTETEGDVPKWSIIPDLTATSSSLPKTFDLRPRVTSEQALYNWVLLTPFDGITITASGQIVVDIGAVNGTYELQASVDNSIGTGFSSVFKLIVSDSGILQFVVGPEISALSYNSSTVSFAFSEPLQRPCKTHLGVWSATYNAGAGPTEQETIVGTGAVSGTHSTLQSLASDDVHVINSGNNLSEDTEYEWHIVVVNPDA